MVAFARLSTGRLPSGLQPAICWRYAAPAGMVPERHEVRLVGHEAGPYWATRSHLACHGGHQVAELSHPRSVWAAIAPEYNVHFVCL